MNLRVNQVKIPVTCDNDNYRKEKLAKLLRIPQEKITDIRILRKSIDARKKDALCYVYTLAADLRISKREAGRLFRDPNVTSYEPVSYEIPRLTVTDTQPVVIGMGPAGLFAAYSLSLAGFHPILLERGKDVNARRKDIEAYWATGRLDPASNVQFGEGGAGSFSDGKLNTQVNDTIGRGTFVLETFVKYGAPEAILYDAKPHIGTDILIHVIQNMREDMLAMGADIRFESAVTDITLTPGGPQDTPPRIASITVNDTYEIDTMRAPVILAIGHSARDTFAMLHRHAIPMQAKEFAVGFRVEHAQHAINLAQYGTDQLGAAPYKLTAKSSAGRGVYSFCMCPGGYVVDSSSEPGSITVNGMSYSDRGSANANSAIVVTVGKDEYDLSDPMAGIAYQRQLEQKAYEAGQGHIPQQLYGDYLQDLPSAGYRSVVSCHKGQASFGNLRPLFSEAVNEAFIEGMSAFGRKIPGFDSADAVLSGVESRTSSPVRIIRDETLRSTVTNLYPCGEGAGYAGGITSAAMDGLKVAEAIIDYERGRNG